jgi:pentatricopeptide repeat protein
MSTRKDATESDIKQMNYLVDSNAYDKFNEAIEKFNPTLRLWELRFYSTAAHFKKERRFQECLEVANEMQKDGFQPTPAVIKILQNLADESPQQRIALADAIQSWSKASDGGRPKMRRQIRTRSRHRLNKSKKNRRRKVRRTRHRNRSYS